MIITCEACGTSFRLKTSMVKESGTKVRCSKCRHVFIVYPPSVSESRDLFLGDGEDLEESMAESFSGREQSGAGGAEEHESLIGEGDTIGDLRQELDRAISRGGDDKSAAAGLFDRDDTSPGGAGGSDFDLFEPEAGVDSGAEIISIRDLEAEPGGPGSLLDLDELSAAPAVSAAGPDEIEEIDFDELSGDVEEAPGAEQDEDKEPEVYFEDLAGTEQGDEESSFFFWTGQEDEKVHGQPEFGAETEEEDDSFVPADGEYEHEHGSAEEGNREIKDYGKGGSDIQLDNFNSEKKPEKKKPSADSKREEEELFGELEEDSGPGANSGYESTEEFELDLEAELDKSFPEDEDIEDEERAAESASEPAREEESLDDDFLEEFELDLDLDDSEPGQELAGATEEDLDLEFDFDLSEEEEDDENPPSGSLEEKAAGEDEKEEEFELDLDFEEPGDESAGETGSEEIAEFDLDLDLDLESESGEKPGSEAESQEEEEDWDLDFGLEEMDFGEEAQGEEGPGFSRNFDTVGEGFEDEEQGEEFELEFDLEPDEFEPAEEPVAGDADSAGETFAEAETHYEGSGVTESGTDELDLSEIEDMLEEEPVSGEEAAGTPEKTEDIELELESGEDFDFPEDVEAEGKDVELEPLHEEDEEPKEPVEAEDDFSLGPGPAGEGQQAPREEAAEPDEERFALPTGGGDDEPWASEPSFKRSRGGGLKAVAAGLIIVVLLGAAAVGTLFYLGKEDVIPFFAAKEGQQAADAGDIRIAIAPNPDYKFVTNENSGEIFVVSGNASNQYEHARSFIKVKAVLYNSDGQAIKSATAFAGNTLSDEELAGREFEDLRIELANRRGDNNSNVGVGPGQSIPFTVIFENPPDSLENFTVEAVSSARQ